MALALWSSSAQRTSSPISWMDAARVDEWCEWERTVLRPALLLSNSTNWIKDLEAAWQGSVSSSSCSPFHLVGSTLTVADICVATTLCQWLDSQNKTLDTLPRAIQRFASAHQTAHQAARTRTLELWQQASASEAAPLVAGNASSSTLTIDMNEPSLLVVVDAVFRSVIGTVFGPTIQSQLPPHIVKLCANPKHGDYQVSAAMPIFAALKATAAGTTGSSATFTGPTQVAAAIIDAIGADHPVVSGLTTQGPGFIVCQVQASFLQHHVRQLLLERQTVLPMPTSTTKQTCVVDFSSPNIAKEMHVGHLRSTIIGEAVCRILEAAGHVVHRVNHVGDWGTQFGMLIQYLKEEYPAVATNSGSDSENDDGLPNITDLTVFYKNAKQRFDESPDFKKLAQTNVVALQSGDSSCLHIWKMLCDVSRREFQKVYQRLDVTCEEFGESFYNDKIPAVIDEFVQANQIKIEEGGAKCVFVDKFKIPLMLQKSDGGYGYDSTDMAALKYRLHELKADRIIIITDFSQGDHFKMIFGAGTAMGWLTNGQQLQHIGFGTVQGEDGKRFKTRSGDTVRLVDLLDEAVHRMATELQSRMDEGKANITAEELPQVAEAIGYGAVKYFDLRRNPTSNYKFSYDQMLDTKGDTAVYLLYARVRLESIMAKAASDEYKVAVEDLLAANTDIVIGHESERYLVLQLLQFTDVLEQTLQDLYPFHICDYVYKLATAASDFVTQCRVLGSPEMPSRILLCYVTTSAMRQCFDLLGIRHVKRI
jgi:arginyl-tRNA synthetase